MITRAFRRQGLNGWINTTHKLTVDDIAFLERHAEIRAKEVVELRAAIAEEMRAEEEADAEEESQTDEHEVLEAEVEEVEIEERWDQENEDF